jgi:hypothetical protein
MASGRRSRHTSLTMAVALLAYVGSYAWYSASHLEVRAEDGKSYVIFGSSIAYYVFRPITYIDAAISGMQFHIGPHR